MGVDPIKTTGVSLSGNNGKIRTPKTEEQDKLARAIANLDKKGDLSRADVEKLKNMSPEEQINYLNNALKDSGYKIAPFYDSETNETYSGINFTSNGVYINYSKGGKTIYDENPNNGYFGIEYKK